MKRIKLTVAYDGTAYNGWQIQPNAVTVEGVLNQTISKAVGEEIKIIGASRTDSGVHAMGNVAVFDSQTTIPPERVLHVLNRMLPEDIVVMNSEEVPSDFHPRYQKSSKTYEYHVIASKIPIPIKRYDHYFVSFDLNIEEMRKAAAYLVGTHDFESFCSAKTAVEDTVRTIYSLEILTHGNEITIRVKGNGFLYNMVRIIAGTLIYVGRGYYKPEQVREILESKDRTKAGVTAPPQGLMLVEIEYESI